MSTCDIAAFQLEAVHEDLAAGFFRSFGYLGLSTVGYFNYRIQELRGDFFETVRAENTKVIYPPLNRVGDWVELEAQVRDAKPKALLLNTLQWDLNASFALKFGLPVMGVVHNPYIFRDSKTCRELARRGGLELFGLAPHVVETLRIEVPELDGHIHLHSPYNWMPDDSDCYQTDPATLDIVIPGAVDYRNRGFEALVEWLKSQDRGRVRPFRFSILAGGPDRQRLEEEIVKFNLEEYFYLEPLNPKTHRVPHAIYLRRLYQSHAILALLPVGRKDYLKSKITTGIMAALGTGRPIIAPVSVGNAYGFTPIEVPEDSPYDLTVADLSPEKLAFCRNESLQLRAKGLQHNDETIRAVVKSLGLQTSRRGIGSVLSGISELKYLKNRPEISMTDNYFVFWTRFMLGAADAAKIPREIVFRRVAHNFRVITKELGATVTLEIGAFEAGFSRWVRKELPNAQALAFEANPYVFERYKDEVLAAGVDYRHQCVGPENGTVLLRVPTDYRGGPRDLVNQMASLNNNLMTENHHEVEVESVRLDDVAVLTPDDIAVAWIDVEGAQEMVLAGSREVLARCSAVFIEVENTPMWSGQWLDVDVVRWFGEIGLTPIMRDWQKPQQYNLLLVNNELLGSPRIAQLAARVFDYVAPQ